ncbi:MAG: hypothetical protein ABSC63_21535, partial [Candidatus Binataceae bacterium]
VYAIDVHSGTVLLSPNFGTPVPMPLGCNNNGPNVGINSTPVIDLTSNTLYVMVYTQDPSGPAYRLHALDLGSLTDKVTPQVVTASHSLTDGTTFAFNATYQRQRPGLLLANGSIYAGFGSFCDYGANLSRGWLLLRRVPSFCRRSGCRGMGPPPMMRVTSSSRPGIRILPGPHMMGSPTFRRAWSRSLPR